MTARRLLAELRARPPHLALVMSTAGLAGGGLGGWAVAGVALLGAVLVLAPSEPELGPAVPTRWTTRRSSLLLAVPAACLGLLAADARLDALDPGSARAAVGRAVTTEVLLLEAPRPRRSGGRAVTVRWARDRLLLRASARVPWPALRMGDVVKVRGRIVALGESDGWLRPRHVHAVLLATEVRATGRRRTGVAAAIDGIRQRAERALGVGVPEEQGSLLRGMVLGQDAALTDEVREDFRRTGLSHLTAASGANITLLAGLVLGVAMLLGAGVRTRLLAVLVLIALYVPLAGAGPSIQRAGVMGAAGVAALLLGRPADRWYGIGLAACVTLALNPLALLEPGWQMSFAAVVALVTLAPRLRDGLRRRGVPGGVAEATAITVAATLGTAPLIALHFDRTSLVALPANVLVAPAVAPAMWLGMLAALLGQVSVAVAVPLSALAGWPAAYVGAVADLAAGLPLAEAALPAGVVAAACAFAAIAVMRPLWRRAVLPLGLAGVIAGLVVAPAPARPPAGPRVAFLAIGQGDATLLQDGARAVLVDTGPPGGPVVERLASAGVRRLDALVVTHAQADHLGAAAAVLEAMPVGVVLDGRGGVRERWGTALEQVAARRRVPIVPVSTGSALRLGAIVLDVHWPPAEPAPPGSDPNERALVAEARVGTMRVLLCADAESPVLAGLPLGRADVLKVAHHGSDDPGLAGVLDTVRPRLAVIEVGADNDYGHPTPATLGTLRAAGVPTLRTDRDGTVAVTPGAGGALAVERFR